MTIYILGGSNSRSKTGWTGPFTQRHPDTVNLSIGANTTMTGTYRLMRERNIGPGDTIIWEYALNDANHLAYGYTPSLLVRNFEHFLMLARERGAKIAPAVFTPRSLEKKPGRHPYYQKLHKLFQLYQLHPFDVSAEYRAALGVKTLPPDTFKDNAHYAHTDTIAAFIVDGVERAVKAARVPAQVRPRYARGERLELIEDFATDTFRNSILEVPTQAPPFEVPLQGRGELIALAFLTDPSDNALTVRLNGRGVQRRVAVSSTTIPRHQGRLFKTISFETARSGRWVFNDGAVFRIGAWNGKGRLHAEAWCKRNVGHTDAAPVALISGLIVLRPVGLWGAWNLSLRPRLQKSHHLRALAHRLRQLRRASPPPHSAIARARGPA